MARYLQPPPGKAGGARRQVRACARGSTWRRWRRIFTVEAMAEALYGAFCREYGACALEAAEALLLPGLCAAGGAQRGLGVELWRGAGV